MLDGRPLRIEILRLVIRDAWCGVYESVVAAVLDVVIDVELARLGPRLLASLFVALSIVAQLVRPSALVPRSIRAVILAVAIVDLRPELSVRPSRPHRFRARG